MATSLFPSLDEATAHQVRMLSRADHVAPPSELVYMKSFVATTTIFCPSEEKAADKNWRLIERSLHVEIPGRGEFEGDGELL
jgi:hypothetical protein